MNNDVDITPLIDTGYVQKVIQEGQNAVFKNGRLVYIILDVDKPGKFFFDLRTVFNASTGEGGKDLKIMFMNNAVPWQLNGKTISIDGAYPSGERFHVTGSENQANSSLIDFTFPLGLFQEAGIYKFQFEITDESGNLATSHYCFFQVTQNATLLAADFKNGVNPFDSDYTEWKNKVEQEINALTDKLNNLNTSADQLEQLMNNYIAKAQQYVDAAWQKKLDTENTWTAKQHFNGGITFGNNAQGDNLVVNTIGTGDLTATGTVTFPNTTSFGDFKANQILNAVLVPGFSGMLMNATKNANDQSQWNKNWWLWASKVNIGVGVDYPCYIMHFDLTLDTSDVGKPIATFNNSVFASSNNAGSTQAVYMNGTGGTMTYHVDSTGVLYLDSVTGISGKGRVRFTGLF
ncbi:MAG TPA: hypothetical protein H9918_06255 [Candidatus Ligilactobacillus faecavium]|nr:hypothetical protein [Candidatus Ligilactobacillus faecavium]